MVTDETPAMTHATPHRARPGPQQLSWTPGPMHREAPRRCAVCFS